MTTKLTALLAASTLVLAACGGAEVETAEIETEDGAIETAFSEEQPPLEGDSPFVDEADVAESELSEPVYGAEAPVETAALGTTYEIDVDGIDEPKTLVIDETTQVATLDGEAYELAMDGERFSFDAPTLVDGEETLMTYSGLYRDGMIEEGLIEAQGDGASMGFTAERVEAELESEYGELRRGVSDTYREGEAELDEMGRKIEATGEEIEATGENAYDRATDGSDATEALDPVDQD